MEIPLLDLSDSREHTMFALPTDILVHHLCPLLSDKDRIRLVSVNKASRRRKKELHFDAEYAITQQISHRWYYNQLRNIRVKSNLNYKYPSNVTHIIFGDNFKKDIEDRIPSSVTHLTLGRRFNQDIQDSVPHGVTHLTLNGVGTSTLNSLYFFTKIS